MLLVDWLLRGQWVYGDERETLNVYLSASNICQLYPSEVKKIHVLGVLGALPHNGVLCVYSFHGQFDLKIPKPKFQIMKHLFLLSSNAAMKRSVHLQQIIKIREILILLSCGHMASLLMS